jgi:hypothetical protein
MGFFTALLETRDAPSKALLRALAEKVLNVGVTITKLFVAGYGDGDDEGE